MFIQGVMDDFVLPRFFMKKFARFSLLAVAAAAANASLPSAELLAAPAVKVRPVSPGLIRQDAVPTAYLSPGLSAKLAALPNANASAGVVIVAFQTTGGLSAVTGLDNLLGTLGITVAHRFESLGMISAVLTSGQITSLAASPLVRSMSDNHRLYYNLHQARVLCGVDKLRADAAMTAQNGGRVVDGVAATQFSVAVIDSGIDTTNTDLPFDMTTSQLGAVPTTGKVIQNVQVVGDDAVGTVTYVPNLPNTDTVAHGTHCAGIIGGTGGSSRTLTGTTYPSAGATEDFSGVAGRFTGTTATDLTTNPLATASGVKVLGLGSGAGLFILDALGGFEYVIANQVKYNIKVTSNSYGSQGEYSPDDTLEIAVKSAYDHGITNVFAAGNSGPGSNTMSSNPRSPWVIAVAAGTKEGGLASFSSRGLPASQRTGDAVAADGTHYNPNLFNLPAITAPGTGREFAFDGPYDPAQIATTFVSGVSTTNPDTVGKKFYSDIISTLAKTGTAARGTNDQEFPTPYQTNYTMISGTSMACPFVAGTCALLLSVNPNLTPAQVKAILQATATHLPDYQDYQAGAGYLNAYAAVDMALNPNKPYASFNRIDAPYASAYPAFITNMNVGPLASTGRPTGYPPGAVTQGAGLDEDFTLPFSTQSVSAATYDAAKTKATTNDNAYAFLVDANLDGTPNTSLAAALKTTALDVRIQFGQGNGIAGLAGGNTIGLLLWAPDGTQYSSGIALPVEDSPTREVVVNTPKPGLWVAEFRGLRGLAAVPVTPPTGVGLPDTVTGQIYRTNSTITNPPTDIGGIPQNSAIITALLNRYFDQVTSGNFFPTNTVSRADFVQVLADNTPLRQNLAKTTSVYTDASGNLGRFAEAAAQNGSTLRDWNFVPGPTLPANGANFAPTSLVSRFEVATALVRAIGLDAEAQNLAGTAVKMTYQGNLISVTDSNLLSPFQRGYLQLAINRGFLTPVVQYDSNTGIYTALALPTKAITRADLAVALVTFRTLFPFGNSLSATELTPQTN
jgi:serine protease AprX